MKKFIIVFACILNFVACGSDDNFREESEKEILIKQEINGATYAMPLVSTDTIQLREYLNELCSHVDFLTEDNTTKITATVDNSDELFKSFTYEFVVDTEGIIEYFKFDYEFNNGIDQNTKNELIKYINSNSI